MCMAERTATKVGHGFGFPPDQVVENPEAEILHDRADGEIVGVRADDPDGTSWFHHAPARSEPAPREIVVGRKAREFVPTVVDGVDARIIRSLQIACELKIVRRIGEDEIDGGSRQLLHSGDAVADRKAVWLGTLVNST